MEMAMAIAMEGSATSWGSGMMILEQAKEELQILEIQHPNRFDYLKLELKSFILLLESQNLAPPNSISQPPSSSVTTQVSSSTGKKRKKCSSEVQRLMVGKGKQKIPKGCDCVGFLNGRRSDRVDAVIERAQACLHKIKQFKTSFL